MNKQEAIDVIEAYRRNMEHILGAEHETVKAISTCEMLVGELEDQTAQRWILVSENVPEVEEGYEYFDDEIDAWLIGYESKNILITDGEGIEVGNRSEGTRLKLQSRI